MTIRYFASEFACGRGTPRQVKTDALLSRARRCGRALSKRHADHCGAAVDHFECACRSRADVDDTAAAIGTAVCYAHDDRFAVANVCNQHIRAKRQCAMGGCKPRWAVYFAARSVFAAVKRSHSVFSAN